jgi:purine-binding chemotaxis protein CheW
MAAHYLSFRIGMQWYGINVAEVVEVLPIMKLNELPVSSPDVLGLITLRDNVVPVIDLRIRFGISEPTYLIDTPIITIRTQHGIVGLMVDDADNVEIVSDDMLANNQGGDFPYVAGVAKLPKGLLMLIDTNTVSVAEQQL